MEKPAEREYRHTKMVRLRDEDLTRLKALAKKWGVSEAGVLRQALQKAAEAEGVE